MSRESHRKYLESAALREAQKAIDHQGRQSFSKDDLLRLRIQTVEPWKRVILGLLALLLGGLSLVAFRDGPLWLGALLAIPAVATLLLAIFGRRKTIDRALDSIDVVSIAVTLFDGL